MSAAERAAEALARIGAAASLNAFIRATPDLATAAAQAADARAAGGASLGPLDGRLVAVKDNIDIAGLPTSAGIGHYRDNLAQADAPLVARCKALGAVIAGKTNLDEAALGATGANPWFGACASPRREGFVPGGSSSGSAAAVAAGLCDLALGTDTMGSVRIPAAYCGIAGFKPTRGALSTQGIVPLSPQLDHAGLLAAYVTTIAAAWHTLQGDGDGRTAFGFKGRRIGVLPDLLGAQVDAVVPRMLDEAHACMREAGAHLLEARLPGWDAAALRRDAFLLCEIDGAQVHAQALARDPEGFSPALRKLLAYGAAHAGERAQIAARLAVAADTLNNCLGGLDLLVLPTCPQAAFAQGSAAPLNQADFTVPANLCGAPALSMPWGADAAGMPLGLQLMARPGMDAMLLRLGCLLEALRP